MARRFLPSLRTGQHPAANSSELKAVLADYYSALSAAGIYSSYRARPWPVERAVAEAYERLVYVFKAVEAIAGAASRLPYQVKDGESVVEDHPLARVLNKRANPLETGRQFRKRLSAQVLLSKRGAFVEVTRSRGGDIVRLDLLPPGRTRPIPGSGANLIDHYRVWRPDGTEREIPVENVRWFREPHPLDPFSGVTPLEAAGLSIELDFFSRLYNVQFLKNDARPGGVLAINGEMDPQDMDRIERRFGRGPTEAGKLSVIAGDVSYVDLAARPRDVQYEQMAKTAKNEILAAFGVPESVLGYAADRTYANAEQEQENFWLITMPPHMDLLITGFDEDSDDTLEGEFDVSKVEVLQKAKTARREEARAEFEAGLITPNEYRDPAGYPEIDRPEARALYIPTSVEPVPTSEKDAKALAEEAAAKMPPALAPGQPGQQGAIPPGQPPKNGSGPQNAAQGGRSAPPRQPPAAPARAARPPAPVAAGTAAKALAVRAATKTVTLRALPGGRRPGDRARTALRIINGEAKGRQPGTDTAESAADPAEQDRLETTLAAALAALLSRLIERSAVRIASPKARKGTRHWEPGPYAADTRTGTKALDAERAVDEDRWQQEADDVARPIVTAAAMAAATGLLTDLGAAIPGEAAGQVAGQAAEQAITLIRNAFGSLAGRLVEAIHAADEAGQSIEAVADAVRAQAARITPWTNTLAASAATATVAGARDDAAAALAEEDPHRDITRQWRARMDALTRGTHRTANGQRQDVGVPFRVGNALLRFPGDPDGPPEETINCRCLLNYRSKSSGQFVPKVPELAATGTEGKDAVAGHHVPGTPYEWRHEWKPRTAEMARRYRKPLPDDGANPGASPEGGVPKKGLLKEKLDDHDPAKGTSVDVSADFKAQVEGTYAGAQVTLSSARVRTPGTDKPKVLLITGKVHKDGRQVGNFQRRIYQGDDGKLTVRHDHLELDPSMQGQGFASEFNSHMERLYRDSGVDRIELTANIDVGGYAWARKGFDWANADAAEFVWNAMYARAHKNRDQPMMDRLKAIQKRMEGHEFGSAEWPTPYEMSELGREATEGGMWFGKDLLLKSSWEGVKYL